MQSQQANATPYHHQITDVAQQWDSTVRQCHIFTHSTSEHSSAGGCLVASRQEVLSAANTSDDQGLNLARPGHAL